MHLLGSFDFTLYHTSHLTHFTFVRLCISRTANNKENGVDIIHMTTKEKNYMIYWVLTVILPYKIQ